MPRKSSEPQVPGEPQVAAEGETPTPNEAVASPAEETVTVKASDLAALVARVNALEGKQAKPKSAPDAALPDSDSIDLSALNASGKPVLTKQGWLVPEKYGDNPARKV